MQWLEKYWVGKNGKNSTFPRHNQHSLWGFALLHVHYNIGLIKLYFLKEFASPEYAVQTEQTLKRKAKQTVRRYLYWFLRYAPSKMQCIEIPYFNVIFPKMGGVGNHLRIQECKNKLHISKLQVMIISLKKIQTFLTVLSGYFIVPKSGEIEKLNMPFSDLRQV